MDTFKDMTEKFAKPSQVRTGTYIGQLNAEEQAEIEAFAGWLKDTTEMSSASISSYRSYLAAALCVFQTGGTRDDLTSSQRSAVNKYGMYLATKS